MAFEGVGQRLVPLGHPGDEDVHHNVPAAQLAGNYIYFWEEDVKEILSLYSK